MLCSPVERVIAEKGQMKIAKMMNMTVTFDHRFLDGAGGSKLLTNMKDVWDNPEKYF